MTGEQALSLLKSDALQEVKEKHGEDLPVLVEGRVGIIERKNYMEELRDAGALGAIVGGALAVTSIGSELLGSSSGKGSK